MTRSLRATRTVPVAVLVVGLFASACSGGSGGSTASSSVASTPAPTTSSATASPSATATPAAKPVNPYTGTGAVPTTPTIAVKIDDTAPGRPQLGIDKADVVYIEAAEGGLTRLAAVFGTNKPTAVGYVRSTRPSDPDLLLQYGKITEAYSGGAHDSLPLVYKSGIKSWSNDAGSAYYSRINRSESSYINLALNVKKVAAAVKTALPKSIGWTFSPSIGSLPNGVGTNVRTTVTGSYSTGTPVQFRWDAGLKKYVRYINGVRQVAADGKPVTATNVIIQGCKVVAHPADTDVNGNPSQFTYTVGTGPVYVFRDGRRINGVWTRKTTADGTVLTTGSGTSIPLQPGNTWVVLIRKGVSVSG